MAGLRTNTQLVLASHPKGMPSSENFTVKRENMIDLEDENITFVVKVKCLSFDAAMRVWLTGRQTYIPGVQIGNVMFALGVGEVLKCPTTKQQGAANNNPLYAVGDIVQGMLGWQEYFVLEAGEHPPFGPLENLSRKFLPRLEKELVDQVIVAKIREELASKTSLYLSLFGIPTYTAFFGLFDVGMKQMKKGKKKKKKILLVSAAAGATGLMVCQLAKLTGEFVVIGMASADEKCRYLETELGVDRTLNYRTIIHQTAEEGKPDFSLLGKAIRACCKEIKKDPALDCKSSGVDLYYDNVGGPMLDAVIPVMSNFGVIVACGAISQYNERENFTGLRNYDLVVTKRLCYVGFIVTDFLRQYGRAAAQLSKWVVEGVLKVKEDKTRGPLQLAPQLLPRLYRGQNLGRLLLELEDNEEKAVPTSKL